MGQHPSRAYQVPSPANVLPPPLVKEIDVGCRLLQQLEEQLKEQNQLIATLRARIQQLEVATASVPIPAPVAPDPETPSAPARKSTSVVSVPSSSSLYSSSSSSYSSSSSDDNEDNNNNKDDSKVDKAKRNLAPSPPVLSTDEHRIALDQTSSIELRRAWLSFRNKNKPLPTK